MKKITKTVTVDNCDISIEVRHRNTETAWVFIHGWAASKSVWSYVTRTLPYTTIAVDLPGFGGSQDLSTLWDTTDYSQVLEKLIDRLELPSVVIVGHSFGGQIAAHLAAQKPEWLTGLVLVDAAVVRGRKPKLLSYIGHMLSPLFRLPGLQSLRNSLYGLIGADRPPADENLKQTMRTVLREGQTNKLPQINVPTHVIWGSKDADTPLSEGREIAGNIEHATLSVIDGSHYVFADAPQAFIKELTEFNDTLK